MRFSSLLVFAAPALLAGCCGDPCRDRCAPCDPCASAPSAPVPMPVPSAAPGAPAGVTATGGGLVVVGGGGEGQIVLVGPDGKQVTLKADRFEITLNGAPAGEGARVVQKDGQTIVIVSEGKEGKEGKEKEDEAHEGHTAPAAAAKAGSPEAPAAAARGYLGFMPVPAALLSPEAKAHFHVTADHGVVVLGVRPGSPADQAGLKNGDALLKFAGQDVPDTKGLDPTKPEAGEAFGAAFAKIAGTTRPGQEIEVVVERDGKPVTLKATPVDLASIQKFVGEEDDDDDDDEKGEKNEGAEGHEKGEGAAKPTETAPPAAK